MATIINTPPSGESSDSGLGIVLGVLIAIILITLFVFYGLPYLRRNPAPDNSTNINVTVPNPTNSGGSGGNNTGGSGY